MTYIHNESSRTISEDLITASTSDNSQKTENEMVLTDVEIYDAQNCSQQKLDSDYKYKYDKKQYDEDAEILPEQCVKTEIEEIESCTIQKDTKSPFVGQPKAENEHEFFFKKEPEIQHLEYKVVLKQEPVHTCNICQKNFQTKNSKERHYKCVHEGEKNFCCEICSKTFAKKYHMTNHVKSVHEKIREFSCEFCDKTFVKKQSMKVHVGLHSGERPYQCQICGLGYKQKLEMIEHRSKHSGTEDFQCVLCQKQLNSRDSLYQHVYRNHRILLSEFTCSICGKQFNQKAHLENHENSHFDTNGELVHNLDTFICSFCEKVFKYENNLKTHMKTHLEGKVQCSECGKYYTTARGLREHIAIKHERISKFKCTVCGKAFAKECGLKVHSATHLKPIQCDICNQGYKSESSCMKHKEKEHPQYNSNCV